MTPDMSADMGDGLAGWAYGSHLWNGMIPAFMEKPMSRARNAAVARGETPAGPMAKEPVCPYRSTMPSRMKRVESWVITK